MVNIKVLPSLYNDKSINSISSGLGLKLEDITDSVGGIISNIEYYASVSGGLIFKKIFLHDYTETDSAFDVFVYSPPLVGQMFILYHPGLMSDGFYYGFPDVINNHKTTDDGEIRLFTTFELAQDKINTTTNTLTLKCPCSIPFHNTEYGIERLVPDEWKELLWNYQPKFIEVGDRIKIIRKNLDYQVYTSSELFSATITSINNIDNCTDKYKYSITTPTTFQITLDQDIPIDINLYTHNTIVSNIFNIHDITGNYPEPHVSDFIVHSSTGNYLIDDYPIETNVYGTVYENWEIKFLNSDRIQIIGKNNNILVYDGGIDSDIEPLNTFLIYGSNNYPFFKIRDEGFTGNFSGGDTIEFTTYGKETPLWTILYFKKDTDTTEFIEKCANYNTAKIAIR